MPYSTNPKAQHVWEKARRVKGKNPNLYRRDAQGKVIYTPAYNRESPMGWQLDHIWPRSKGGSDARRNRQVQRWSRNFGPVVKVDHMKKVTIQNEETKEPLTRV